MIDQNSGQFSGGAGSTTLVWWRQRLPGTSSPGFTCSRKGIQMLRSEKFAHTARADLHRQRARPRTMSCWAIFWRKPVRRPYLVTLLPGADPYVTFQHPGLKFLYFLSGEVTYRLWCEVRWRSGQGTHCCSRQRRCMDRSHSKGAGLLSVCSVDVVRTAGARPVRTSNSLPGDRSVHLHQCSARRTLMEDLELPIDGNAPGAAKRRGELDFGIPGAKSLCGYEGRIDWRQTLFTATALQ